MPSTPPFDVLDSPYLIEAMVETPVVQIQTGVDKGKITPRSFSAISISGHVSFQRASGEEEELTRRNGLEATGKVFLHSETLLKAGDKVRVHHDSSGTVYTDYRVVAIESRHPIINRYFGVGRKTYHLERTGGT